jgi:hypothetical protein
LKFPSFPPPAIGGGEKDIINKFDPQPKRLQKFRYLKLNHYTIAVSFEKRLIFITFSQPSAGRKYTDKFTFEDFFKA